MYGGCGANAIGIAAGDPACRSGRALQEVFVDPADAAPAPRQCPDSGRRHESHNRCIDARGSQQFANSYKINVVIGLRGMRKLPRLISKRSAALQSFVRVQFNCAQSIWRYAPFPVPDAVKDDPNLLTDRRPNLPMCWRNAKRRLS